MDFIYETQTGDFGGSAGGSGTGTAAATARAAGAPGIAGHARRGGRGPEYATEAGMRMYFHGGNAVDAGVATMLAASVVEFSHFGFGGEAPILVRTKDGKVHAIAGVGTMPKLATAQFFRNHKLTDEADDRRLREAGGMKDWVPVAGILPALVPGMVEAALVTLREYGTKSFAEIVQPAIDLADGFPIDELRVTSINNSVKYLEAWPDSKRTFLPNGRPPQAGDIFRQADLARTLRAMAEAEKHAAASGANRAKAIDAVRDFFYRGEIARRIDTFSKAHSGLIRYEDMAAFRLEPEDAVSTTFKGYTVYKPGFWSQGPGMIEALNILEGYDLAGLEAQLGGIHPRHGGSAQTGLRRPRHLLRRPQVQ